MPDHRRLAAGDEPQRARHVALAVDAGEDEDGGFHPSHVHLVILDHGIGQQLVGGLLEQRLGLGLVAALDLDVEHLALAHAGHALQAKRAQRAFDGLALRVENAGFQGDGDAGFHVRVYAMSSRIRTGAAPAIQAHT